MARSTTSSRASVAAATSSGTWRWPATSATHGRADARPRRRVCHCARSRRESMADRRLIAQSIVRSGQVRQLVTRTGPYGALLFTWALTFIDDDSRLDGSPGQLQGIVFGRYPEISEDAVAEMLAVMNDIDLAVWYEVVGSPGERYLYFPRFTTHQTLREDRYGPSRLPPPPGWVPEQGHPYSKNDERKAKWKPGQPPVSDLRHEKPQRDLRRTTRVAKRPVNKGVGPTLWEEAQPPRATSATAAQPERDRPEPPAHPLGAPVGTEDAPRPASSRLASEDSSRLATAQPPAVQEADELRSTEEANDRADTRQQIADAELEVKADRIVSEATGLWRTALCMTIRSSMTLHNFVTWFERTRLEQRGQTYYIVAPNEFQRDWLNVKYEGLLRASIGVLVDEIAPDVRVVLEADVPAQSTAGAA